MQGKEKPCADGIDAVSVGACGQSPGMADFKKLRVWKKAHALALNADRVAMDIRKTAHRSLKSQLNRAALSIPANIVEGRGKKSDRDFARYLGYALGSATELEYHITLARDVGAMSEG